MRYDVIVVGGGPAGSAAAHTAASAGATVLLLDRARFPRDKPCGGGVNVRAARLLPFDLTPVVEREVTGVRFTVRLGEAVSRRSERVLTYMTRRTRLDAYLADRAVASGAEFRDEEHVADVEANGIMTVRTRRCRYAGRVLIGADGANGVVARLVGLAGPRRLLVAIEGAASLDAGSPGPWVDTLALDLGSIAGGYGWVFPKGDHLNVGVGGWKHVAGRLRAYLAQLARRHGLAPSAVSQVRGHHLPIRPPGVPIVAGRAMLAGDAAGLVDPLSGEGIYAAVLSGRAAAATALDALDGRAPDLLAYQREVDRAVAAEAAISMRLVEAASLVPPAYRAAVHSERLWEWLCALIGGEASYASLRRRAGPLWALVDGVSWAARHSSPLRRRAGLPEFETDGLVPVLRQA